LYHATAGSLLAADVLAVDHMEMLNGGNVNQFAGVLTDNFGNKSQITVTDMEGSNGVIHMINAVMLPNVLPELGPEPEPEPEPVV
ncbi:fasciclin domain-containing protein, partial [Planctomycetota bacterium]